MLRYLRTAIIGLLLGLGGIAVAQTINSALQLSQDARGLFGVDTNNNLYIQFNRHLLFSLNAAPAPTTSSTGCSITANSTDANGQLTGCTGASATVTFGAAFLTAPRCLVSTATAASQLAVTTTTSILTITPATTGATTWNWFCGSVS